jgi:hypothetical protein
MNDVFQLADDLGPAKVIHIQEPARDDARIMEIQRSVDDCWRQIAG